MSLSLALGYILAVDMTLLPGCGSSNHELPFPLKRADACLCLATQFPGANPGFYTGSSPGFYTGSSPGFYTGKHDGRILADHVWYQCATRKGMFIEYDEMLSKQQREESDVVKHWIDRFLSSKSDQSDVYARLLASQDGVASRLLVSLRLSTGERPEDLRVGRNPKSIDVNEFRASSPGYLSGLLAGLLESFHERKLAHTSAYNCLTRHIENVETILGDFTSRSFGPE